MADEISRNSAFVDIGGLALTRVLGFLPHGAVMALGALAGRLMCAVLPKKRRRIRQNLERIAVENPRRSTWQAGAHIGRTMAEMSWLLWQSRARVDAQIRLQGLDEMKAAVAEGRGALLAAAHIGNWELGAQAAARAGVPVAAVARLLGSPRTEAAIARMRSDGGVQTLIRGAPGSSVAAYRCLRNGHILACMMDRLSAGRRTTVPFLGAHVRMPLGPLMLARRTGSRIVVGDAFRGPDGVMNVIFRALPHVDAESETIEELAHRVAAALEAVVAEHPEQWYWIYRRPAGPGDPSDARSEAQDRPAMQPDPVAPAAE
jgi:KDO2-lipid IV(A) lauroyltransferase